MKDKIVTSALVKVENNKLLCVRSKGKELFYLPGGKIEANETPAEALKRELKEELNLTDISNVNFLFEINDVADASDKELVMSCFTADINGKPVPCNEIEEVKWLSKDDLDLCAPALKQVIKRTLQ